MPPTPSRPALPRIKQHWRQFHALMPFRVREVLLVSSAYDAFLLEEDGPLSHRLFNTFSELELTWAPRVTHVSSAEAALDLLSRRPFQLVLMASSLVGTDLNQLAGQIRALFPSLPIVLLVFDEAQLGAQSGLDGEAFDHTLLWSGDTGILIAIVKLVEDSLNLEHDVAAANVQVIAVVEDDVRTYSGFLTLLYPELLRQSRSLVAEGVNEFHRLLRIHARPKIVLATSFEEATHLFNRWGSNLMGVISDVAFPYEGKILDDAGFRLLDVLRSRDDPPPMLLRSTDGSLSARANEYGVAFANKNSPDAMPTVRRFLKESLGFGEFVFRLPDRTHVGQAGDVLEMADVLDQVPLESILHHAQNHHFSRWLKARSMFELARHTRGILVEDFKTPERVRTYLQDLLREASEHDQAGVVADLAVGTRSPANRFMRIGSGSIGGKARSIGFVSSLVYQENLLQRFPDLEIRIPKTVAISVSEFEQFIQNVDVAALEHKDDAEVRHVFTDASFPESMLAELHEAYSALRGPLAVRSSSLREDSRFAPFAGVYATYMLPNNHPDPEVRFRELQRAIKSVYASMFVRGARTFSAGIASGNDEEKMAVVVQQLVGQRYDSRFYPQISGVAQSYNYYPIGSQRADEGLAVIALGLGQMVVDGGGGLRFSPAHPDVLPQFSRPELVLKNSQKQFFALNLSQSEIDFDADPSALLELYDLSVAEADGTLSLAGSVYSVDDDAIRENLNLVGPRIVTFANVLRWRAIPLAAAIQDILESVGHAMGSEVEIEFAVEMGDWGVDVPSGRRPRVPRLFVLQARPMAGRDLEPFDLDSQSFSSEDVLLRTERALGNGRMGDVRDIVYVRTGDLSSRETRAVADEISELDRDLGSRGRSYLLIGPGRWGSSDPNLGIPVEWPQIRHARVIVETPLRGEPLESSQGTHFFHNLTSARAGYLTVSPKHEAWLDQEWLDARPSSRETRMLRHVELEQPLAIFLDGRRGRAVITKPGAVASDDPD